jgi:hypothetical protein
MRDAAGGFGNPERFLGIAALLGALGCTGVVGGSGDGANPGGPGGPGPGTGGSTGGPGGGTGGFVGTATNPGRGEMHRLNANEYNATVKDVLGTTAQPANANWRGGQLEGFDNIASQLGLDDGLFTQYVDAADTLSTEVVTNPALKAKFVTCATEDAACVSDIISKAGLKIFRRPLRPAEVTTYQKVYTQARAQGVDHDAGIKHVLWSLLSSAEFLYRIELPKGTTKRPLDGFELASRMSYFLWTSAPDDALLQAASQNALSTDAQVQTTLDRMLADPKASRFVEAFAGQWLGGRKVTAHAVAADKFPLWTQDVATAATDEIYAYFSEFLHGERKWTDFLKADINFVNAPLAAVYGMTGVTGTEVKQVSYTMDQRSGFLGLAGFLAMSSMDRRTSPTLRGKWVLSSLLCTEAPPPPANVPKLEVGGTDLENGNVRQALEKHRTRADCANCHAIFDPFGMALEKYDAIGRYRETYNDGSPIDDSATLEGAPFAGLNGAADIVTSNAEFNSCVTKKMFIYALGRSPSAEDEAWVQQIKGQWETSGLTLKGLVSGLVKSVPFRNSGDVK